jgi:peptidoglycan/LPS O-acetylase OafA/YrhL
MPSAKDRRLAGVASILSVTQSAPRTAWRADIQGLRALAVIFVVAFHAGLPTPGGFVGVDVFFVISGFVITSMLHREYLAHGRIRFGRFYARRFKRLTPALALMICVTLLASVVLLAPVGPQETAAKTGIGATLISANIVIAMTTGGYFESAAALNPLLNTWSLSIEEQFYLVFPLVLAFGWWFARRDRRGAFAPLLVVGGFGAVSFFIALFTASGGQLPYLPVAFGGFYSPVTRAWEFAAGALLALLAARGVSITKQAGAWLGVLGAGLLAVSLFAINGSTAFPGVMTLIPVCGTLLLLAAGFAPSNAVSTLLSTRPAVRVGDLSYSWYLWHWPMIVFAGVLFRDNRMALVITALLSLAPAIASYRFVESPIRSLRSLSRRRFTGLVAITVIPPLVIGGVILLSAGAGYRSDNVKRFQEQVTSIHLAEAAGCHPPAFLTGVRDNPCAFNASATGAPIYLVGDSNAAHFSEAVLGAAVALGRPLLINTIDSCPAIDVGITAVKEPNAFLAPCRAYIQNTLGWLQQQADGLVVIAGSDGLILDPNIELSSISQGKTSTSIAGKAALMQQALVSEINQLEADGHQVLLVQQVPHYVGEFSWDPRECTMPAVLGDDCSVTVDRDLMQQAHSAWHDAITLAGAETNSPVLELTDEFCDEFSCFGARDGLVLYRDSSHISVAASKALSSNFVAAIKGATGE